MSDTNSVTTFRLWPGRAPGAVGDEPQDVPTLSVHRPRDPDGSAVVVCPGGGYSHLAPYEADPVAEFLGRTGVTGIVLRYRLSPRYRHPAPFQDVTRAMRWVRARADELKLDPARVGVLGFSAGGHLAAHVSTRWDRGDGTATDPIDRHSSRPDVSMLLYPVISFDETVSHHIGSRKNLLGTDNPPRELIHQLSCERHVTSDTPPAFLFHTVADDNVPVENCLVYAAALRKAGVPYEMHLYEQGVHGVGLASEDQVLRTWPGLLAAWLAARGFGRAT